MARLHVTHRDVDPQCTVLTHPGGNTLSTVHRRARRPRGRFVSLLAAAALAVGLAGVLTPAASAALTQVGPVDPDTKFPTYYADQNGLSLGQCLDGLPFCLSGRAQLTAPAGEVFYFSASSTVGPFTVSNALEGSYLAAGAGQEQTFMRTQVSAPKAKLAGNTGYTITDPYGAQVCTTDKNGVIKVNGCRIDTAAAPGNVTNALGGRIGPFLTWDTIGSAVPYGSTGGAPPVGYIGDNVTPHKVTGSPTGFNKVRVEGPNINTSGVDACPTVDGPISNCDETDLFTLQGKLQAGASAAVSPAGPLAFGSSAAGTPVTRRLTYTSTGTDPVAVSAVSLAGPNAADFATTETCTAVPAPGLTTGQSCTVDVTFTPQTGVTSTATLSIADNTATTARTVELSGAGATADAVAPTITGRTPAAAATSIAPGTPNVSVTFSEPVQGVTPSTVTLTSAAGAVVPAVVTQGANDTWTLTPNAALSNDTRYTVAVTGGPTAVRDLAGNPLTSSSWSFLTGPAPTISSFTPVPSASGVSTGVSPSVTFNESVVGVSGSTFTLTNVASNVALPATVTQAGGGGAAGTIYTMKPAQTLAARTTYRITVTGGPSAVRDVAGNPFTTTSWTFTTK